MSQPNFADKTIWTGDNLDILRGLNSKTVNLIYLAPPSTPTATTPRPSASTAQAPRGSPREQSAFTTS